MQTHSNSGSRSKSVATKANGKARSSAKQTLRLKNSPPSAPSDPELKSMIATAAYYFAEQRRFEPGCEFEDWIKAEQLIRQHVGD